MAIEVQNVTRGQALTAYFKPRSLHLKQSGAASIVTCSFDVVDLTPGSTLVLQPEDEILVTDGGSTAFRGPIRNRVRADTGLGPSPKRVYKLTCQDPTSYLTDDVLDDPVTAARPAESARVRVQWIASQSTKGVTAPDLTVQDLTVDLLPEQDLHGRNLYEALEEVAKLVPGGAQFYVDFDPDPDRRLHWFQTETEDAPWDLSDTPDGVTTFGYDGAQHPDDSFELINAVYCLGGPGTVPVWRPDPADWPTALHTTYGRREGTLRDPEILDQASLEAAGDAVLAAYSEPKAPTTLTVFRPGLRAGMLVGYTNSLWGIAAAEYRVSEIDAKPLLDENALRYEVTLGDRKDTLASTIGRGDRGVTSALSAAAQALENTPDAVAPDAPTGLALSSGVDTADDGTTRPYLDADWDPNTEPDLQAYELEVDEANRATVVFAAVEVVGGGTMPAGSYSVQVTATGPHGETAGQTPTAEVEVAAGNRLQVTVTGFDGAVGYKVYASRHEIPLFLAAAVAGANVFDAEGSGPTAPTSSTFVDFSNPTQVRSAADNAHVENLLGGTYYGARVRALDDWNNRSPYSAVVGTTTARDVTAPAIPTGLAVFAGFRLLGANWQRVSAADLERYEVRYRPVGDPDWTRVQTRGNTVVLLDLTPDTDYEVAVRAVDRSNNVQTSDVDATAVDADEHADAGWSPTVNATPTLVGAADVAFNSVVTDLLASNRVDASTITAGTLSVGGTPNTPDFLLVYNAAGQEVGRWDQDGLLIKDPNDPTRQVKLVAGVLSFSSDNGATWSTAVGPDGILADSIRLGSAPGGHNAIPNASFELSAFATWLTKVWTSAADWATGTSQVGVNVAGTSLTLTAVTY